MGIDYVLDVDCAAKQQLGIENIVSMSKSRSRAEAIIALDRQNGSRKSPSEIKVSVVVNRMGKLEETQVSAQQLLDQAAPLAANARGCASCPSNRGSEAGYGCYDSINYPIETDTETWLLSRLPAKIDGAAGYLLKSAIEDFGWDGAQAAEMREQRQTYFRSSKAPVRKWPGFTLTGDQLFQMMFHVGHLGPEHSKILLLFLGLIVMDEESEEPPSVELESANAEQMARFVNTLVFAVEEQVAILIDG
jgi:hypothetical protein